MNLVAADVRRLILIWAKKVRASLRRLLRFRASIWECLREIHSPEERENRPPSRWITRD